MSYHSCRKPSETDLSTWKTELFLQRPLWLKGGFRSKKKFFKLFSDLFFLLHGESAFVSERDGEEEDDVSDIVGSTLKKNKKN